MTCYRFTLIIFLIAFGFILPTNPSLAQNSQSIRSINFHNMAYTSQTPGYKHVLLNKGKYISEGVLPAESRLVLIRYVDFNRDGKEEAVVVLHTEVPGSAGNARDYYVFSYDKGKLKKRFHEWRERGGNLRIRGQRISIEAPYWAESDGHCCNSFTETVSYRWQSSQFVRVSRQLKRVKHSE